MNEPDLFPLEPSPLTLGVPVDEVLVPLDELRRTNCCSRVELDESDSKEELDLDVIQLGQWTN